MFLPVSDWLHFEQLDVFREQMMGPGSTNGIELCWLGGRSRGNYYFYSNSSEYDPGKFYIPTPCKVRELTFSLTSRPHAAPLNSLRSAAMEVA